MLRKERRISVSDYRIETDEKRVKKISTLLEDAPSYVSDFYNHIHNGAREISTQLSYLRDILNYLKYLLTVIPDLSEKEIKDVPITVIDNLSAQDINEYRDFLREKGSPSSVKKKLAALSTFFDFLASYQYIDFSPMSSVELPKTPNDEHIIKLNDASAVALLNGIWENKEKLVVGIDGNEDTLTISRDVWLRRERCVLRNFAIVYLFLGTGLRVSELVGINCDDIDFSNNCIHVILKGGKSNDVYFGNEVKAALLLYRDGMSRFDELNKYLNLKTLYPPTLFDKFSPVSPISDFCRAHILDENFETAIKKQFPDITAEDICAAVQITGYYRRHGRAGFVNGNSGDAFFLSNRGKRISVRMVQVLIKELVKTYVPELEDRIDDTESNKAGLSASDREKFSPHKLRATCATRILKQTGDIELAALQLNHSGVQVTAQFYAKINKEDQRKKIAKLSVLDSSGQE